MRTVRNMIIPTLLLAVVVGCSRTPDKLDAGSFATWYASEESGLVKTKSIKGLNLRASYVPNNYLAYREWNNTPGSSYDSILKSYKCGLTFHVSVSTEQGKNGLGNLLYYGASTPEEIQARIKYLNFNIAEFVSLSHGDVSYEPVLSSFDGYDPNGNKMNFQVVFTVPEFDCGGVPKKSGALKLTFDDPLWQTGTSHFEFDEKKITTIPELTL